MTEPKKSWHDNLPFPRHWVSYVALKYAVLTTAVFLLLHFLGVL